MGAGGFLQRPGWKVGGGESSAAFLDGKTAITAGEQ